MENFIDELLAEVEEKELQLETQHIDLILIRIRELQEQIASNLQNSEQEIKIINDFYLSKSSKLQDRIEFLEHRLETFILEQDKKTIDLPNGTLRLRKGREKVVVENLSEFLQNQYAHELTNINQDIKPDIKKIRDFITRSGGTIPNGVKVIPAIENVFNYKLREVNNEQT